MICDTTTILEANRLPKCYMQSHAVQLTYSDYERHGDVGDILF